MVDDDITDGVANLCLFMMLYELLRRQAVEVAELGLHHDRHLTQGLLDDAFRDAIDRPADVRLKRHNAPSNRGPRSLF